MEGISIKKVSLANLYAFVNSEEYMQLPVKPISQLRALSYAKNTRAINSDYVLYLAFKQNILVGFRTILHDTIMGKTFGWFSGNWVNPEFRRQGISSLLYNEVVKDWSGRLLYTNYAPASKALYDKSENFTQLTENKGLRIYFNIQIYNLLSHRLPIVKRLKGLVIATEFLLNNITKPYAYLIRKYWVKQLQNIQIEHNITTEIAAFINQNSMSIFERSSEEYKWALERGWVSKNPIPIAYPFTYKVHTFENQFLVARKANKIIGVAWVKNIDHKISVPYFYAQQQALPILIKAILGWAFQQKGNMLTVFNQALVNKLSSIRFKSIVGKSLIQKYFIIKDFKASLPVTQTIHVQDGDGDVIFT